MPDRYVSDTSSKCMTLTQSRWVTTWVDSCYSIIDLIGGQNTTGGAIARDTLGNYLLIDAARVGSSVHFALIVEPGIEQEMAFDISYVNSSAGSLLAIEDSVAGVWKTLNSVPLDTRGNIRLPFVSLLGNVRVSVTGPTQTLLNRICRKKPVQYQESYLTQVCNGDKDRYRFGFNGMEKDNELKGVGNSLDFNFRIYDSRLGRFLSVDPIAKQYPWNSTYAFAENRPIDGIDLEGLEYMSYMRKYQYTGSASDYMWAIENGLRDVANAVPATWNGLVDNYNSLKRGTWSKDFQQAGKQIINSAKEYAVNQYNYSTTTPFKTQLLDVFSPQGLEFTTAWFSLFPLSKIKITNAVNIGKVVNKLPAKYMSGKFTIGSKTFSKISKHLEQFGAKAENTVMLDRLKKISKKEIKATDVDINFARHELRESELQAGFIDKGMTREAAYEAAHEATLKEQNMYHRGYEEKLYTPEAIKLGNDQLYNEIK
jgi:RHS repeat-associated protein